MKILLILIGLPLMIGCVQPESSETATGPNSNPAITILKAEPSVMKVGELVTVTAVAGDADDDDLLFEWYMTAGDLVGNGSVVRYVATYCCAGVNTIRLTVKDGRGGIATKAIDVYVQNP